MMAGPVSEKFVHTPGSNPRRYFSILADVLLIAAVVAAGTVFLPGRHNRLPKPVRQFTTGQPLTVSGIDWRGADRNIAIILGNTCPGCEQEFPFYQELQ